MPTKKKNVKKSHRRRGSARPIKSLSTGYKGLPNEYRFVRETRPAMVDLGDAASAGVTLLAGTGTIPNQSIFTFPNFSVNQLAEFSKISALFANYCVDRIETYLVPMWETMNQQAVVPLTGSWVATANIPNLMVTRINTKRLIGPYVNKANAELNRDQLAAIQKKSRSLYSSKKWMKVFTANPPIIQDVPDGLGAGGTNQITIKNKWLSCLNGADQIFNTNHLVFADRLDNTNFVAGIHKYRYYHRVHFRCSFVG